MKEELLRVLNNKLTDINNDIDSLVELNNKISKEQGDLSYITNILDLFGGSVMNFSKLSKEDFSKLLDILGEEVKNIFASPNCNYDGLVYLINGINDGVSLTLTEEQNNGIEYLIQKLTEKKEEHERAIDGYNLVKNRYSISDVEELKVKKEKYLSVLSELDNKHYVSDMDLLSEAIEFSNVTPETTIDILKYLLEYNADIYESGVVVKKDELPSFENKPQEDEVSLGSFPDFEQFENKEETNIETPLNFDVFTRDTDKPIDNSEVKEKTNEYPEFHFNDFVKDDFTNYGPISFDEESKVSENTDYVPLVNNEEDSDNKELDFSLNDLETNNNVMPEENDELANNDLRVLLENYGVRSEDSYTNELFVRDIKNYESILDTLKNNNLIDIFKKNSSLLVEILLYSNSDIINKVLGIIKEDLSTDEEDFVITTKIAINTIPSIFVGQNGNYSNFIENVRTFKDLELNLINLFDFSKELFVADHETIMNNLEVVRKYDINLTYQNAKYLLLLSNIGDRIDYYVESVYEDKEKHETFDGLKFINEFTAKLNVVTDETIKRLRFSSENGKKVFGTKPGSLTGDITNLKVNSLDITGDYLSKFFNNEFATLTGDEVREYTRLIHNSSNVGNYDDELDVLEKYHNGSRYTIAGINVSYNKVLRNYSILRSYGIDNKKALHFAVCYNLVITKDEYDKLKVVLDNELGGN